ncbi:hypothetical protein PFICI_13152 [Pestalotiopsis fici W106-1]|uniref:Uncharacterized protein n=1 Tax=Pestalotiopsis fici (strain W106-1 / CGMCC3.15140) TaxID=1229662 RepID=W3WLC3_PESFW|nr:uncharacterized protein PFICI_13152 [Pestalotiopsis fici W106-1]ETS74668.1 hypothetical protein PFICI_13152 [Pestalotiopsis fici W106-1]
MAAFEPVPEALIKVAPRYPGDKEPDRQARRYLKQLNDMAKGHDRPYSWGLTVFRTTYTAESDETFPRAIERLKQHAHAFATEDLRSKVKRLPGNSFTQFNPPEGPLDPAPNEELSRRFYCDIIEDAASLDGADAEEVGRAFDAWLDKHRQLEDLRQVYWGRYHFCILMDEQGIDHLLQFDPSEPPRGHWREKYDFYVKVVTVFRRGQTDMRRFWLRVGIKENIFILANGVDDIDISEIGMPDPEDAAYNWYGLFPYW